MSETDGPDGPEDELAPRRAGRESALRRLLAEAATDRRDAAADRQRAAEYLVDAYRDELTGVLTRRAGRQQLHTEVERAHRTGGPLAVVFVDVDGLKDVNDARGHDAGDELLAAVGRALRTSLRSYDVVVRFGGDEFVCALPGGTPIAATESDARARHALAQIAPGATFSTGHAQLQPNETLDSVIHRADRDLYQRRADRGDRADGSTRSLAEPPALSHNSSRTSLACGACGGRIPISAFTLLHPARMTRSADCPACGETTLVQLARHR